MGIVGLRLSEVVRAYGSEAAAEAKETFVMIPLMSEVGTARALVAKRRESREAVGQGGVAGAGEVSEAAEREAEALGATSGLVPIFWSEALAVQTAAGKRRKLLFFREGDLQAYLVLTADC